MNRTIVKKKIKENLLGYGMILPALILMIGIGIVPILKTISYSFQYYSLTDPNNKYFVGLDNYITLVNPKTLEGENFYNALKNTIVFSVYSVIGEIVIGYITAVLMNQKRKFQGLIRVTVLIPWAVPGIIVAQMFSYIFNDQLGVLNQILMNTGMIQKNIVWLANKYTAMAAVVTADIWKQFPYVALMFLAGLQVIDKEQYEAARVDGAGKFRCFLHITVPNLKSILLIILLFRTMGAIRIFDMVYGMTGGGPANTTDTLLNNAYQYIFSEYNYGMGSATATIITLIIIGFSFFYIKILRGKE